MTQMSATLAKLPDQTEQDHFLIAVEEAAHAVWAVLSGARVLDCWARPGEGRVSFTNTVDARAKVEISYAGFYTNARVEYGDIPTWDRIQDAWRYASAEDRAHFAVVGGGHASLPRDIEPDIEHLLPHIGVLAAQLYACGTATHEDVESALGVTADSPLPLVRSLMRARTLRAPDFAAFRAKVSR